MKKEPDIASGRVEGLLAAIAKPHVEHPAQGQTAANFDTSVRDEMQGQQRTDPMQSQDYYLRPDEAVRPQPVVEHGGGELPPQVPAGDAEELLPIITPVDGLGRKP
jgi:hypothetical protein